MMESKALSLLFPSWDTFFQVLALACVAGLILSPLEGLYPAHPQKILNRKGVLMDLFYWFMTPLLTRTVTALALVTIAFVGITLFAPPGFSYDSVLDGFCPLSRQPHWIQAIEILVIADFVDYWTHRTFHRPTFWKVHAIHHSPEEMNWLSSSRVHPLNDLVTRGFQTLGIMVLGFSAEPILAIVPLISFYVMFLHSNIRWDFGPFRWLLVSPAFHRWHHSSDAEALDMNFSGIFPVWDVLFGTAYFPKSLPTRYGLNGTQLKESLLAHLAYPFTKTRD